MNILPILNLKALPATQHDNILEIIGAKLFDLRIAKKESLEEVAKALKISPALLSRIENGKYDMKIPLLYKICYYYKVKPSEIVYPY